MFTQLFGRYPNRLPLFYSLLYLFGTETGRLYVILTGPSVQVIDQPHLTPGFVFPAVDYPQAQLGQFLQLLRI